MQNRAWIGWTVALAVAGLAAAALAPKLIRVTDLNTQPANSKVNLHIIQLALERYAVDHDSRYPAVLAVLAEEGYLPELPANSYGPRPRQPMPEVPLGEHVPGGVTYVRHFGELDQHGEPPKRGWYGYTLLVYGDAVARRKRLTLQEGPHRIGLTPAQTAGVPWDYVLLRLMQAEGKGGPVFSPLPEPAD